MSDIEDRLRAAEATAESAVKKAEDKVSDAMSQVEAKTKTYGWVKWVGLALVVTAVVLYLLH